MKNLKVALIGMLLLSALSWWACNKEHLSPGASIVDVAFAGRVIDESGLPVVGAQVQVGSASVLTDNNGVFRTAKVKVPDNDAILRVTKNTFFEFSRAYYVEDKALKTVTIQLMKRLQVGSFNNASGGTISIPGGPTLKFPANATDGSGSIRVYARYLNPSDANLGLFMPGDLRAINTAGEEQALGTFGMVVVELESSAGKAQIAEGKEVELNMPILSSQVSQAPSEIPLWYFDIEKSRWIEEGTAQKVGNQYVGSVKHFSFWNCDVGLSLVQLSGKVYIGDEQHPLANAQVILTTTGSGWPGYASTDQNGCFGGGVIKDVEFELTIKVYDQCGTQILYTQTVGPFSSNTTLPPIILTGSTANSFTVTGVLLDCDGQPVTNGYVRISPYTIAFADENGVFSAEFANCTSNNTFQVRAFDLDNLKESPTQSFTATGEDIDLGSLTVCTGLDEYIQYTLDGSTFVATDPSGYAIDSMTTTLSIYLSSQNGTTTNIYLGFSANTTGTYPMDYMSVNSVFVPQSQVGNVTTNLTTFPEMANGYFIGTFGGTYLDNQGASHTISGNYRVKRDF